MVWRSVRQCPWSLKFLALRDTSARNQSDGLADNSSSTLSVSPFLNQYSAAAVTTSRSIESIPAITCRALMLHGPNTRPVGGVCSPHGAHVLSDVS
ncbi:hypothetical protein Trydic_g16394 [Trypoxylus dichotomus]